ncbi:MAG TPA: DUF2244 domain-containing protein [Rhizomicrobium sp.]|jgi:uncharacterized membrane protein
MRAPSDAILFEATLRPNPPLPPVALKAIVAVAATFNLAFGIYFVWRGAWPVTPFMGADVVLLAWALNATRQAAKLWERLTLTPESLAIERHPPKGLQENLAFNPYWLRVDLEEPMGRRSRLTLHSHGRAVEVGAFLAPCARLTLAEALRSALRRARETPLR